MRCVVGILRRARYAAQGTNGRVSFVLTLNGFVVFLLIEVSAPILEYLDGSDVEMRVLLRCRRVGHTKSRGHLGVTEIRW